MIWVIRQAGFASAPSPGCPRLPDWACQIGARLASTTQRGEGKGGERREGRHRQLAARLGVMCVLKELFASVAASGRLAREGLDGLREARRQHEVQQ
eukprot:6040729-Pyramimonas_sp.AAC.1